MKHAKTIDFTEVQIRKSLEIHEVPHEVDEQLQRIYLQLPENFTSRQSKPRRTLKAVWGSVATVAALLAVLVGINASNPAFAESIPLVGGIFKQINKGDMNAATMDIEGLENKAVPIPVQEKESAIVKNDCYEINVINKYYDGRFIHTALKMKSNYDPSSPDYFLQCILKLNGQVADTLEEEDQVSGLLPITNWIKTSGDTYITEVKFAVPEAFRDEEALEVEYKFALSDEKQLWDKGENIDEYMNELRLDRGMDTNLNFSVTANTTDSINMEISCENEGATLHSFYTSPGGTEISVTVPMESDKGTFARLYTMEGKKLGSIGYDNQAFTGKSETTSMDKKFRFDGLKEEYKQVLLRLYVSQDDDSSNRYIEFLIDKEKKSITPSHYYADKTSPLFYSAELEKQYPIFYATYRADDSELKLDHGYKLEYLSSGGVHKAVYMTIVTPENNRELKVELYVNGELRSTGFSKGSEGYLPFKEYVYDDAGTAYNEDGSMWIIDSGYIERDMSEKDNLNIQRFTMGSFFFQLDDKATIKIYDSETGDLLHEEDQILTQPEGVNVEEGQQIYRKEWADYTVINTEKLD